MSFGFSTSDIAALVKLCTKTFLRWKGAYGDYNEVSRELSNVQYVLLRAERDAEQPRSLLTLDEDNKEQWSKIAQEFNEVLTELQDIVKKHKSLGSNHVRNWDRLRFNNSNLKDLRRRLTSERESVILFLNMIQVSSQGRTEQHVADSRDILLRMTGVMDDLAAQFRAKRIDGSVVSTWTNYDVEDGEIWREFRRDLYRSGFSKDDVKTNSKALRSHLEELVKNVGQEESDIDSSDQDSTVGVDRKTQDYEQLDPTSKLQDAMPGRENILLGHQQNSAPSSYENSELTMIPGPPWVMVQLSGLDHCESRPESFDDVEPIVLKSVIILPPSKHTGDLSLKPSAWAIDPEMAENIAPEEEGVGSFNAGCWVSCSPASYEAEKSLEKDIELMKDIEEGVPKLSPWQRACLSGPLERIMHVVPYNGSFVWAKYIVSPAKTFPKVCRLCRLFPSPLQKVVVEESIRPSSFQLPSYDDPAWANARRLARSKCRLCLPPGWGWSVDSLNRVYYFNSKASSIDERYFWQPPALRLDLERMPSNSTAVANHDDKNFITFAYSGGRFRWAIVNRSSQEQTREVFYTKNEPGPSILAYVTPVENWCKYLSSKDYFGKEVPQSWKVWRSVENLEYQP